MKFKRKKNGIQRKKVNSKGEKITLTEKANSYRKMSIKMMKKQLKRKKDNSNEKRVNSN